MIFWSIYRENYSYINIEVQKIGGKFPNEFSINRLIFPVGTPFDQREHFPNEPNLQYIMSFQ